MMVRRLSSERSLMLKAALMAVLVLGTAAAWAQSPDVQAEHASQSVKAPATGASQSGFHDLICKPNGTEDGFDCADEATPAKIVPIPSQVMEPRPQDRVVAG
jgi:uncharacterized membrane protein